MCGRPHSNSLTVSHPIKWTNKHRSIPILPCSWRPFRKAGFFFMEQYWKCALTVSFGRWVMAFDLSCGRRQHRDWQRSTHHEMNWFWLSAGLCSAIFLKLAGLDITTLVSFQSLPASSVGSGTHFWAGNGKRGKINMKSLNLWQWSVRSPQPQ